LNRKEQDIADLVTPTVESLGCELWGVEYLSQGRHSKVRIYIERPEGVSIDDCERVSREVSDLLDVEEMVADAYTLEVSSPGMDRILFIPEHYAANIGQQVDVRLNFPFEGRKRFVGLLVGFENDEAIVRVEDEEYLLPRENIQRARLVPQFD
jgi:ribosome maturation factor RimP